MSYSILREACIIACVFVLWGATSSAGCSAHNSSEAPGAALPATTPTPRPAIENTTQQAGGINTHATGINYASGFGLGASACVCLALVLTLALSHRREMKRIAMNGKH